ncbi:hypothetical protein, partial [Chryseobacterium sp.]|uniref:hypothetical protein n=1 Tax=Chryseobacterium sp. TaxID=1871047 RepID=UPI003340EE01
TSCIFKAQANQRFSAGFIYGKSAALNFILIESTSISFALPDHRNSNKKNSDLSDLRFSIR